MRQFVVAGGLVMLGAAALAGNMASGIVSEAAVEGTATSSALFVDSFLSPLVQGLAEGETLDENSAALLENLLTTDPFEARFPHLEIWKRGGLVVYSKSAPLIGRTFPPPEGLVAALEGNVTARYADLTAAEHVARKFSKKYLEIYVPLREHLSGRVIAVAEIHERPETLENRLFRVRTETWIVTIAVTFMVMAALFGIVHRANRTIQEQKKELKGQIARTSAVSEQNRVLKERAQRASSRLAELNAKYLRGVGADLHDGPTQLMGLAALKTGHVRRSTTQSERTANLDALDCVIAEAIKEVRTISKGLMLPEIEGLPLCEVVTLASDAHKKRTGTAVLIECEGLTRIFPHAVNICVYRLVQEGLNNAFKHARGLGQSVSASYDGSVLIVSVKDKGSGENQALMEAGLGLIGMRERVETLGGVLDVRHIQGEGTSVEMRLPLSGNHGNG